MHEQQPNQPRQRRGSLPREVLIGARLTLVAAAMAIVYTLVVTGISQVAFNSNANGGLITRDGEVVGALLIGQSCPGITLAGDGSERITKVTIDPRYFQGRLSYTTDPSTGDGLPCNAASSAGSNLGPSNPVLVANEKTALAAYQAQGCTGTAPVDLVTSDFTGFDPDISEAAALYQVPMVARARGIDAATLTALVQSQLQGRILFVFGEPHINVLQLNLALDSMSGS
jgi:potassium-transporting ATPase KdpC subunit